MKDALWGIVAKGLSKEPLKSRLIRWAKKRPYRHIPASTGAYMERYWILHEDNRIARFLGLSVRLHIIKQPDNDRALHTHPFPFRSLVIDGAYLEVREGGEYFRHAGTSYRLDKDTPHMIKELFWGIPAITVFITGKRVDDWYFHTFEGFIPHEQYLNAANKEI